MFLTFLLILASGSLAFSQQTQYDLLIQSGRIIDGTGAGWFIGDVGVKGDSIVYVGPSRAMQARVTINAAGLAVTPGFIDTHSHGRRGILDNPKSENQIRQGVTTIIEGPDGSSPLPLAPFLRQIAGARSTINFGSLVGQGSIREKVIGLKDRKATSAEMEQMKTLARDAMLDGAFGLSTGLFYIPGNFSPTEEVIEIAKLVGKMGGIHTSHMRNESAAILDSVRETIRIGEDGGLPTQVTHHKIIGKNNWGISVETLRLVEEARARGVDVTLDQYPYTASSTGLAALFPQWSRESGNAAFRERANAPEQRARILAEVGRNLLEDRGAGDPKNVVLASCGFDKSLAGKNLAEVTASKGREVTIENAALTALELQLRGNCSAIYHAINEEDLERIMRYPHTMIASDGGIPNFGEDVPHPRNYGTFARVLGRYVRERKVLTLEEAVRRMTSLPAGRFRIMDRGLLRPGMKADIAVFDAALVADKSEFAKPHQYAVGFRHVVVNGQFVMRDEKLTGARSGRVLYGPAKK